MEDGMTIAGFEVLSKIGESALTEVWNAYQVSLDRYVNLKFLKPEAAGDSREIERFIEEARDAAGLRHPTIIAIYNVGFHEDVPFIILEHVEGATLYRRLKDDGALLPSQAAQIGAAVAEALEYAWNQARLIHRCVSPLSIRIEADGSIKFGYIGMSVRVNPMQPSRRIEPGSIEGIPYYMSPEQARGDARLDFRTDMYGLGATLYHMVTGHMPFENCGSMEAVEQQIRGRVPSPRTFDHGIPDALIYIIRKLMRKTPRDRYECWEEVVADLRKVASGRRFVKMPGADEPPSTVDVQRPATPRKRILVRKR